MSKHMPKVPLVQTLRELLRDVFRQRGAGVPNARFARALGYTDGYMQALIDAGLAAERELLQVVAEERCRADGPGSAQIDEVRSEEARAVA
ncbi:MAG TPA: hypothetical protein VFU02_03320 [Polyangiaceae bacterium]|nr:hypothetical protein [Polyangiaceae bacterium]